MLIYCAPINEQTKKWGVYCIPRMWRKPNGELAIYFNGMADVPEDNALQRKTCPDLFFISRDDGETWEETDGKDFDLGALGNVDSPYLRLKNGKVICVRGKDDLLPVHDCAPVKTFVPPYNGGGVHHTYRFGDLPADACACELWTYDENGTLLSREDVRIDFPEREFLTMGEVPQGDGFVPCPEWVKCGEWSAPYLASLCVLPDGTLGGTCYGQNPEVSDRYCGETYFMVSSDGGRTWKKRACITKNSADYLFGLAGDGYESSLAVGENGRLYFVARTDMSIEHPIVGGGADTVFCVSDDNGYTWSKERMIADSSITPHVISFQNGAIAVVYGRPGVHMILSEDGGETFSEPFSIIGKTLQEELAAGNTYMTSKYFDTCSYSNTFVERLDENSFLILYTNLKYDPGDGQHHKAGFVRKITIEK